MSTMSFLDREQSDELAKRFAHLAASYFDEPDQASTAAARIPLENLFRMLQMFRYDAFSDEPRCGILELGGFGEQRRVLNLEGFWHRNMQMAINTALGEVFAGASRDDAVGQIQSSLTWLATKENPPAPEVRMRTKAFLERFLTALG